MAHWFDGKSVLVTGAASGIGAAAAQRFAADGGRVCLADTDLAGCDRIATLIRNAGGKAATVRADVSNAEDNVHMIDRTVEAFGNIDIAFLNAGYRGGVGGFGRLDLNTFDRVIRTNLYGCFYGMTALYSRIETGGAVVVTASIAGLRGLPENPAYSASKHGILGLVRSAAAAYAARGVRINAICPGNVSTPMLGFPQTDALVDPDALSIPEFRGMSTPQHIAEVALFLASGRAAAINGAAYVVDAGWTAVAGSQSPS
jgi:NAD(P)-dependent dehydrogenase (short-subunit alcohol dehydrogenase family)